jgi:hypothetical protein
MKTNTNQNVNDKALTADLKKQRKVVVAVEDDLGSYSNSLFSELT